MANREGGKDTRGRHKDGSQWESGACEGEEDIPNALHTLTNVLFLNLNYSSDPAVLSLRDPS